MDHIRSMKQIKDVNCYSGTGSTGLSRTKFPRGIKWLSVCVCACVCVCVITTGSRPLRSCLLIYCSLCLHVRFAKFYQVSP